MVAKEEVLEMIARYVEMLKTPPRSKAELEFHLQIVRHLRGMLGAWDAFLKSK